MATEKPNILKGRNPNEWKKRYKGTDTKVTQPNLKKRQSAELRELKAETSRLNSMANKRIRRLQEKGMSTPAYDKWIADGGEFFSVRGKDWNETQKELARVRNFIDSKTSSIRGATNVLKEMAENTGIQYDSVASLQAKSNMFFELASKTEQYLRMMEDSASAIGYQKIWEAINQYVEEQQIELDDLTDGVSSMVEELADMITKERDSKLINKVIDKDGFIQL